MAKASNSKRKMGAKSTFDKTNFMPACVMADIIAAAFLGVSIYSYKMYGEYGINDIPLAAALCGIAAVLTVFGKQHNKKNDL